METSTAFVSRIKRSIKQVARPIARAAQPAIENSAANAGRRILSAHGLRMIKSAQWNETFDKALDELPAPTTCTRDQYRQLVQPTDYRKLHALVLEGDKPRAMISIRERAGLWEPVAYQALPGMISPATDPEVLGLAINALGLHVQAVGIGPEAEEMNARHVWRYEASEIMLQEDFDSFCKKNSSRQFRAIKRARKKCADMEVRIDGDGDLDWIVDQWTQMWLDDPANEEVAAPDRIRFWKSLERNPSDPDKLTIHSIALIHEGKIVAGIAHTRLGGTLIFQCTARDPEFDTFGVGVRVMDASIQWAAEAGHDVLDLGGGGSYKQNWAMKSTFRNIVVFRPKLLEALSRLDH